MECARALRSRPLTLHAWVQVDAAKKRAAAAKAAERRAKASRGWVGWLWGSGGGGTEAGAGGTAGGEADEDAEMRGDLTPEDEEALKELSNEQEAALSLGAYDHMFTFGCLNTEVERHEASGGTKHMCLVNMPRTQALVGRSPYGHITTNTHLVSFISIHQTHCGYDVASMHSTAGMRPAHPHRLHARRRGDAVEPARGDPHARGQRSAGAGRPGRRARAARGPGGPGRHHQALPPRRWRSASSQLFSAAHGLLPPTIIAPAREAHYLLIRSS